MKSQFNKTEEALIDALLVALGYVIDSNKPNAAKDRAMIWKVLENAGVKP